MSVLGNQLINVANAATAEPRSDWEICRHSFAGKWCWARCRTTSISGIGRPSALMPESSPESYWTLPRSAGQRQSIVNIAPVNDFHNLAAGVYVVGPRSATFDVAGNTIRRQTQALTTF